MNYCSLSDNVVKLYYRGNALLTLLGFKSIKLFGSWVDFNTKLCIYIRVADPELGRKDGSAPDTTAKKSDSSFRPRSVRIRPSVPDPTGFVRSSKIQSDPSFRPRSDRIRPSVPDPSFRPGSDRIRPSVPDSSVRPRSNRIRPSVPDPIGSVLPSQIRPDPSFRPRSNRFWDGSADQVFLGGRIRVNSTRLRNPDLHIAFCTNFGYF